jgi:PAS domain S-box-containing protein
MSETPIKIFLIEDNPADARLIREMLTEAKGAQFHLECAENLKTGLQRLAETETDVVLLDLGLPESQGLETFIKVYAWAASVPIVVLTGLTDEALGVTAVQAGAQDYLLKGQVDARLLSRSIRYAIERKRSQEELRKSKDLFEKTFSSQRDAIFILDGQTPPAIRECNLAATEVFGYNRQEMLGRTTAFLHHNEKTLKKFQELLYPAIEKYGVLHLSEFQMKRKDGTVFPTEHSVVPLMDEQGGCIGWVSVVRDITERKRAEEALRMKDSAITSSIDAIAFGDLEGNLIYVNPAFLKLWGYEDEKEVRGRPAVEFWQVPEKAQAVIELLREKGSWIGEMTGRKKDGSVFDAQISASIVKDDAGQFICMMCAFEDITTRKVAVEALRESEENFRTLAESAIDGILIVAGEGETVYANKQTAKIAGYCVAELLKTSIKDLAHPDELKKVRQRYKRRLEGKPAPTRYETVLVRKDGKSVPIELAANRTLWRGRPADLVFIRDITERKRAEQRLRKSQEHAQFLADVLERSSQPFAVGYPNGRLMTCNGAYCELTGYTREGLRKVKWTTDLTPKEWQEVTAEAMEEIRRTGKPQRFEKAYIRKDGSRVPVEVFAHPIFDDEGDVQYYYSFLTDITERKQAEQALRESEERYRTLFEASADGILIADIKAKKFKYANPAICKMLGFSEEELVGMGVNDIHPKEAIERAISEFEVQARGEKTLAEDLPCLRKDGEIIYADINTTRVSLDGSECVVGFFRDITERKRLEGRLTTISGRERRRIGQDLHDGVGQHLTGIAFLSKVLERKLHAKSLPEAADAQNIANLVNQAINDVKGLARGLSPVDLSADGLMLALEEFAENVEKMFGISCVFRCKEDILIDEHFTALNLYRMVEEAVDNAIKHGKARNVLIGLNAMNDRITLVVKDDGVGLPEVLDKKNGMGLNIMNYRARSLGALLDVRRGERGGTVVTCSFSNAKH